MFHKDTLRLIRKTAKRFVTIFLIVLIGVGFMVGLMSAAPTMRASVDGYFDQQNFMDIQLYSSYGFDDEDVYALKKSKNVEDIYATKFADVFVNNGDSTIVTRVQELNATVNEFQLLSGRMPEKENEALALGSSSFATVYSEGDTVKLFLEEDDLGEVLSCTEYEIVGVVRTPQYLSSSKETSTLNNLTLSTVIFVDEDNFLNDYYTSVYLTFKNAKEYNTFSEEYKEFIEENTDQLDEIISEHENVRKEEIIEEITKEVEDGEKELEEEITKAQKEIDDGRKELEEGYINLKVAEVQLETSEKQIAEGEKQIVENEAAVASGEKQLNDGKREIESQTGMGYDEAVTSIKAAYGVYVLAENMLKDPDTTPEATINQEIEEKNNEMAALREENTALRNENTAIDGENATLKAENIALEAENLVASDQTVIDANNLKIEANNAKIAENDTKITENNTKISDNNARILEINEEIAELEMLKTAVGDEIIGEIPGMINEMFNGDIEGVYAAVLQMEEAEVQLKYGRQQLEAAKAEVSAGKTQIADAKKQIADGWKEYEEGLAKLEDGQKELDEEYEKARIELDKAKQQLAELPESEWMILDRDSHYSTAMFKGNADQMKKIGNVFPMLFCLVAALVCMTTMKRLVEEQRSQIGVFSAIGFSKKEIIAKYAHYALAASILGSGIGIPIGVFSLPWVIYVCWQMMYDLPPMQLTMPLYIAVIGIGLFTFLMLWVTITVVKNAMKESPSQLMRPKAPRTANKIFVEKIPFIWNRFSFTSKVTARNIIRYKSRFFMTVIGVAGCTSLLVLGFGIKGSISQVITRQYEDIINYNITISLEDKDYLEDITNSLQEEQEVEAAVPFMTYSTMAYTDSEDKAIQVYVMDDRDIEDIISLRNRRTREQLEIEEGVVISEKFSKLCGIKVGDDIIIESSNGIKKTVEVTGICEMYANHFMFIGDEFYTETFDETVACDNIAVKCTDSEKLVKKYRDTEGVDTVADFSDTISTFSTMLDTLDIIVIVIIVAAGSLAVVVITNLTEVNVSERIREIATLKVLGFNNREVYAYIFKEVFLLSLLGMILGLPLAKLELLFVMDIIEMEMVMFSTVIEPLSYIYGFAIILAFTVMVILLMRKTLRNVEMVESLKSVE